MNSITKRWIKGSLMITIALLLIAEVLMVVFVRNSYYSAATAAILGRINTINGTLTASANLTNSERVQLLYRMSEEFSEKEKFEFMFMGPGGNIMATSSGFMPSDETHIEDIQMAMQAEDGIATNIYITSMGEKVLSATCVVNPNAENVYSIRLVTSLENVEGEIGLIFAFSVLVVLAIIAFSIFSGMYFVKSIVRPIHDIEKTAAMISKGNFDVRIENNYNDEIGALCGTINNMAQELGRSDEIKNEFISSVSHELRTPLTAIKGWAETMNNTSDVTTIRKGTDIILNETERLYTMVENLLDFSRIQQAEIKLIKEKLDLVAEVGDAVLMYGPRCEHNHITLEFTEPDEIIPVFADKNRLKQVFVNLLDNAVKYTPEGGKIEVRIIHQKKQKLAIVQIKDNGKGVHPDDLEKITQKFYKGKGAKRGSGIGLALVSEIVKAHSGQFKIESKYGQYTSAKVILHTVRTLRGK